MRDASVGGHWLAQVIQMCWSHANQTKDHVGLCNGSYLHHGLSSATAKASIGLSDESACVT